MNNQKGFVNIVLIVAVVVLFAAAAYFVINKQILKNGNDDQNNNGACTDEAMQCPDGSFVGRTGPNCEFAQCPGQDGNNGNNNGNNTVCTQDVMQCSDGSYVSRVAPSCAFARCPAPQPGEKQVTLQEGQRQGPLLVQTISPTSISGMAFKEYPVANVNGEPVTMRIGDTVSNGCNVSLTLVKIQDKKATFFEAVTSNQNCPI
jgi:hypothetical protein